MICLCFRKPHRIPLGVVGTGVATTFVFELHFWCRITWVHEAMRTGSVSCGSILADHRMHCNWL